MAFYKKKNPVANYLVGRQQIVVLKTLLHIR